MQLPIIAGLSAGFVPHRQWSLRRWLYANPIWYYHAPRTERRIVAGERFYELVDPLLRELCRTLNEHGLATTPSCEGHFHPDSHFRRVWEELKREEPLVRGEGLKVRDSETDALYLFRDADYGLPWGGFEEFLEQATRQQGIGYVGIVVPPDRGGILDALKSICGRLGYTRVVCESPQFHLFVNAGGPTRQAQAWRELTGLVEDALRQEGAVGSGHGARG